MNSPQTPPSPTEYLAQIEDFLRRNLHAPLPLLEQLLRNFYPGDLPLQEWRDDYFRTAPAGDRNNMTITPEERDWIANELDELNRKNFTGRQYRQWFEHSTRRRGMWPSRVEQIATSSHGKRWTLEEDLRVLQGHSVRGGSADYQRRLILTRVLTPMRGGTAPVPILEGELAPQALEPVQAEQEEPSTEELPTTGTSPTTQALARVTLGHGVEAGVTPDGTQAWMELGGGGIYWDREGLQATISRLTALHGLMAEEAE